MRDLFIWLRVAAWREIFCLRSNESIATIIAYVRQIKNGILEKPTEASTQQHVEVIVLCVLGKPPKPIRPKARDLVFIEFIANLIEPATK